jgi:YHS domain-containing protein
MAMVIDPVCGQQPDSVDAVAQGQYQGKTYCVDATECQRRFEEDQAR